MKKNKVKRWKLLKECNEGDWVYYDAGDLAQVVKDEYNGQLALNTGAIKTFLSQDSIVYPLTLHTKMMAEGIKFYENLMYEKKLINGSRWVNWLNEKMGEVMELPEDADESEYNKIWNTIKEQIKELEYHKSFLI